MQVRYCSLYMKTEGNVINLFISVEASTCDVSAQDVEHWLSFVQ